MTDVADLDDSRALAPALSAAVHHRLLAAWRSPERGYHDARHLAEVLDRLDELSAAGVSFDRQAVRLAAWFHDAVYEGTPQDEVRSAQWAVTELEAAGAPVDLVGEVERLVLLTVRHDPDAGDLNGAALCDADLAILAADPQRYRDYTLGVRSEYAHYDDASFAVGRIAVLEELAQGSLFRTEHGRTQWEPLARANLAAELLTLKAQVPPSR